MKFLCGGCRAKYRISDDKLENKVLTIRCRACGARMKVREPRAAVGALELVVVAPIEAPQPPPLAAVPPPGRDVPTDFLDTTPRQPSPPIEPTRVFIQAAGLGDTRRRAQQRTAVAAALGFAAAAGIALVLDRGAEPPPALAPIVTPPIELAPAPEDEDDREVLEIQQALDAPAVRATTGVARSSGPASRPMRARQRQVDRDQPFLLELSPAPLGEALELPPVRLPEVHLLDVPPPDEADLNDETVRRILHGEGTRRVELCQSLEQRRGGWSGRLELSIAIAPDGSVSEVSIAAPRAARGLVACIARHMKELRFPAFDSRSPKEVRVPVLLEPPR